MPPNKLREDHTQKDPIFKNIHRPHMKNSQVQEIQNDKLATMISIVGIDQRESTSWNVQDAELFF